MLFFENPSEFPSLELLDSASRDVFELNDSELIQKYCEGVAGLFVAGPGRLASFTLSDLPASINSAQKTWNCTAMRS